MRQTGRSRRERSDPQKKSDSKAAGSTLYLFYCSKRTFSSISNRPWRGERGLPIFIGSPPPRPPPPVDSVFEAPSTALGLDPWGDVQGPGRLPPVGARTWQSWGPEAPGDSAPRGARRGRGLGAGSAQWGGARPPRLRHYWPRAPDWRVNVTGWAHPLGNVFSLLHS